MEPVAIIGIGCRFPGGANGPQAFWRMLTAGTDAVTEVPAERWSIRDFYAPNRAQAGKTVVLPHEILVWRQMGGWNGERDWNTAPCRGVRSAPSKRPLTGKAMGL